MISLLLLLPRETVRWTWWKNQKKVQWWRSPCWLFVGPWLSTICMRATPEMGLSPLSGLGSSGCRLSESWSGFSPTSTLFQSLEGVRGQVTSVWGEAIPRPQMSIILVLAVANVSPYHEAAITSPILPTRCPSGVKWRPGAAFALSETA